MFIAGSNVFFCQKLVHASVNSSSGTWVAVCLSSVFVYSLTLCQQIWSA